jgi:hypothetical protein
MMGKLKSNGLYGLLGSLGFFIFGQCTPSSADEIKSEWCGFRATVKGRFDLTLEDPNIRILHANQSRPDYLATWICEGTALAPLPEKTALCSASSTTARALNARLTECIFERDPLNRFVRVFVFMKAQNRTVMSAVYVSLKSKLSLTVTNYGLSHDELLKLFEGLIAGVHFTVEGR